MFHPARDTRAATRTPVASLRSRTADWLVLVGFIGLTLVITYPLPVRLATHLAGDDYDVWARPWATWWTKTAIRQGYPLYHTPLLFYPAGVSLRYHSFSHTNTALALLVEPLVGFIAAHNVTVLLAYLLSGFGMYLLAKHVTRSAGASLVAGLIFAFSTYHVDQSSHLIVLTTQWIPLWIRSVVRLFQAERPRRHALPAALFLALTALSSWHLLLFSLLWLGLYLAYLLAWERERLRWPALRLRSGQALRPRSGQALRALGLMGAIALLLVAPLLFPLLAGQLDETAREWVQVPYRGENAIDVLAFFVPSRRHPLIGPLVEPLHQRIGRRQVFLGYTAMALALLGLVKDGGKARFWALSTLVFFSMSLGAYVRFNGVLSQWPLQPWYIPLAQLIRDPTRFTVMTTLGLALLAALGAAWLLRRAARRARAWTVVGLSALMLFEYLPWPFPTSPVKVPAFYQQLQQETELFALADIPVRALEGRRLYMFYQIVHQKPIVEGIVGRTPPDAYAFIDQHPILSAFTEGDKGPPGNDVSRHLTSLAQVGVRYLVLHRRFLSTDQLDQWQQYLPYAPFYQDDQIIVYRTHPVLGEDLEARLQVNEAMGLARARLDNRYPRAGEPVLLQAAWVATERPRHSYRVRWALLTPDGHAAWTLEGEPVPGWPTGTWQAGDFGLGQWTLSTDLPPGPYRLQVQLVDGQGQTTTRDIDGLLILPAAGPALSVAEGPAPPVAVSGDQVAWAAVDVLPGDQMLHLVLEWRALRDLDRDYKLFVHLLNGEGELVRQVDTMPRDWAAPTASWRAGETVSDLVSLDTYGLPAGLYTLSLGLYDATTQERLPLRLADGSLAPDAMLQREVRLP